ncbi:ahpC/TSA family protein [Bacteroides sp. CAG:927]|jgi:thiol-disulfide isomerase/thioredoxin|nr:ahpC/TSA family protein [Bacteroides sp. CAG:927]
MFIIAIFAVLLVSMSAHTERVYEAADGFNAPDLTVDNSHSALSLSDLKGKYVLVTFWASSNAQSRISAARYDDFSKSLDEERFCLLSVNFDRSERLFREIVRRDNLSAKSQFYVSGSNAETIFENYHLGNGFQSFLINPQGKIVATNPSNDTLKKIVCS